MGRKITLTCINCEKHFEAEYKKRNKKYCSRDCYFEHAKKTQKIGRPKQPDLYEIRSCVNCGVQFEERKRKERKLCSDECRKEWGEKIKDYKLEKSKNAIEERHGVQSIFELDEIKQKSKKTIKERYGVDNPMKNPYIKEKLVDSKKQKNKEEVINKLKKYNLTLLDEYETNKNNKTGESIHYRFKCNNCGSIFKSTLLGSGRIPICRTCYPSNQNSKLQEKIERILKENNIQYFKNDRSILSPMEIDLYIPNKKIGIEIHGNYWHCELFKDKNYHLLKTEKAKDQNISMIQIFEDEIYYRFNIVKSRLENKLGLINKKIYARSCYISEIDNIAKRNFLNNNHIQGDSMDKIKLGLFYEDELISVMTFSKKRKVMGSENKEYEWELVRFCNKNEINVIGSFNKLLKFFVNKYNPKKIITYSDIRWNGIDENNVYNKSGFNFIKRTQPNYWYIKKHEWFNRLHRFKFRKNKLIEEGYDPSKTEHEIMNDRSYYKIWDCGTLKYEMDF